jgi:hypothetical protein
MMWAFALWGICHIAVYPVAANIIVAAAIIILALVGACARKSFASTIAHRPEGSGLARSGK